MFPGWTAARMFQPAPHGVARPDGAAGGLGGGEPALTAPTTALRPFIERAFGAGHVRIDFAGFSGETLHGAIQEPLDKIRTGLVKPASLAIRLLLPDTARPMSLPCRAEDLADDEDSRQRAARLTARHAAAILDDVDELVRLGLIADAGAQIRVHRCAPLFKLYLLGDDDAFFGFYPIVRNTVPLPGGPREIFDLMGKDSVMFHHSARSGDPAGLAFIGQARNWFDTMWQTISYEHAA